MTSSDSTLRAAGYDAGVQPSAEMAAVDPHWAWARYSPSEQAPWDIAWAAHLYRRAGFGATWGELQQAVTRGPHATIDELLEKAATYPSFAAEFDGHETAASRSGDAMTLNAWWLRRLRESPWPLLEKLTLFWTGFFAIRSTRVGDLKLMLAHVRMIRKDAMSDFTSLLGVMAADPAMYAGLGGEQNRKARPNLHFARPWLEAFTVGPEVTTSAEIAALAQAWTGWFVYGGKLRFIDREHDSQPKEFLGHQAVIGRDDAIRLLADHPATATNLARRLFHEFISESASPPDSLLAPIAERLQRKAGIGHVVEVMLRSNLFFSRHAFGQRVKSPVELVVGLMRSLEGGQPGGIIAEDLADLGQRLDAPPTVRGWPGGVHWLNSITMTGRVRLCEALVRGTEPYAGGLNPAKVTALNGSNPPAGQARGLIDLLVPSQLPDTVVRRIAEPPNVSSVSTKAVLEKIVAQPEFQLC